MSADVRHQFLYVSVKDTYYTRYGLAIRNVEPSFIEPLIRSGRVRIGERIPDEIWRQIVRHHLVEPRTKFDQGPLLASAPAPEARVRDLRLILTIADERAHLSISLPPVDDPIAADRSDSARLVVAGRYVALGKLRDRYLAKVPASETPYTVQFLGTWPPSVDKNIWRCGSRPVEPMGTIFAKRQGELRRQHPGATLLWGETIHFMHRPPLGQANLPGMRQVATLGSWRVVAYQLPTSESAKPRDWLESHGFRVANRAPDLELLSLPHSYDPTGKPVVAPGTTVFFEIDSAGSTMPDSLSLGSAGQRIPRLHTVRLGDRYFSISNLQPGSVEVSAGGRALSDLLFQVAEPVPHALPQLRVRVGDVSYSSFSGEHTVQLERRNELPDLRPLSPIPVRWTWRYGRGVRLRRSGGPDADFTAQTLTQELSTLARRGNLPARLEVECGCFGTVRLAFDASWATSAPPVNNAGPILVDAMTLNIRQRQLRIARRALRRPSSTGRTR